MNGELNTCRICLEDEGLIETLISPCRCSGSSKYVHIDCLQTWRRTVRGEIGENNCMECQTEYIIRKNNDREEIINLKLSKLMQVLYYIPLFSSILIYMNEGPDYKFIKFLDGGQTYPTKKCITYDGPYQPLKNHTLCYPITVKGYIENSNDGLAFIFYFSIVLAMYSFLLITSFSLYQTKILKNHTKFFKKFSYIYLFLHLITSLRMVIFYYILRFDYPFACLMLSCITIPIEIGNITKGFTRYKDKLNEMNDDIFDDDTILTWSENYIEGEGYDMIEIDEHINFDEGGEEDDL